MRKTKEQKLKAQEVDNTTEKINKKKLLIRTETSNAVVMERMQSNAFPELSLLDYMQEIRKFGDEVNEGDMSGMERMLTGQAHALQAMFMSLIHRAQAQEYLKNYNIYMGLALKAQAQSRATIQALAEVKYPKQVIVTKQANIAQQQQVNNGRECVQKTRGIESENFDSNKTASMRTCACVKENQTDKNELLENQPNCVLEAPATKESPIESYVKKL